MRNHDAFHERQVLRAFGSGEHLAERDWVIGSEVRSGSKSLIPARRRQKTKSSPGESRGQNAKPQPGGRTQDLRISGQTRVLVFLFLSVLTVPSCRGGLCTCWPTKRWPPDSYRTVTFYRAMCNGAGLQGLASARMTADLRNW